MNVMLKNVLELQLSIVHELRGNIEAVMQSRENLNILPLPCPTMVKLPRATNEK